tara:strand:+ start:564 stop:1199 length:636 start_codon:yes stop_codon:yes gene_type:complete
MSEEAENTEELEEQAPKKKKKLIIPWKGIALYSLPAIGTFIIFIITYNMMVKAPPSREQIEALLTKKEKSPEELIKKEESNSNQEAPEEEKLEQGSDIPFIGPQHYYQSFTGALATDLKNDTGILTIELAVSIFMGKLNADTYFENFRKFEPALRSVLLGVMRSKTKVEVESKEGKVQLQQEMLKAINDELKNLGADPEIKTVQFTKILII